MRFHCSVFSVAGSDATVSPSGGTAKSEPVFSFASSQDRFAISSQPCRSATPLATSATTTARKLADVPRLLDETVGIGGVWRPFQRGSDWRFQGSGEACEQYLLLPLLAIPLIY